MIERTLKGRERDRDEKKGGAKRSVGCRCTKTGFRVRGSGNVTQKWGPVLSKKKNNLEDMRKKSWGKKKRWDPHKK